MFVLAKVWLGPGVALVLWSRGALVLWSCGPPVPWSGIRSSFQMLLFAVPENLPDPPRRAVICSICHVPKPTSLVICSI